MLLLCRRWLLVVEAGLAAEMRILVEVAEVLAVLCST